MGVANLHDTSIISKDAEEKKLKHKLRK